MKAIYVLRLWLPDRPGALGAVASRVGAVGGDVVGIDVLERGAGRAIDEIVVELPDADLTDLLITEVQQVDGVDVEDIRRSTDALPDPRLDALATAVVLVGACTTPEAMTTLCNHARRTVGATWAAVISNETGTTVASDGRAPKHGWLSASADVARCPLPTARSTLAVGRDDPPLRPREKHQVALLARIVDLRLEDLLRRDARRLHPATG